MALSPSAPRSLKKNAQSIVVSFPHIPPLPSAPSPQSAIVFTSVLSFVPIQMPPSAIAPTLTPATPNQPMPNHPPSHLFHLTIRVKVLSAYPVDSEREEEVRRRRRVDICITRSTGMRRILIPTAIGTKRRRIQLRNHIGLESEWGQMEKICRQ